MPPLADGFGERIFPEIIEYSRPIVGSDLPAMPANYWERWGKLHQEVEDLIREQRGVFYKEDPFYTHIGELLPEDREYYSKEMKKLQGWDYLMEPMAGHEEQLGPRMIRPIINPITGEVERSPYGIWPVATEELMKDEIDPRLLFTARESAVMHNIGERGLGEHMSSMYWPGGRPFSPKVYKQLQETMQTRMNTPGRSLIFDVESASLSREQGVWQIAAQMVGPTGEIETTRNYFFKNPWFEAMGEIGETRQTLDKYTIGEAPTQDFYESLRDLFRLADEADYVGGHNVLFDYGMITHKLKESEIYRTDLNFRSLADRFMGRFFDEGTGEVGKGFIDTLALSHAMMGEVPLAKELAASASPQPFSLQNLVLETDLVDRIKAAQGEEAVTGWIRRGMHYADVDVPIESHLWQALQERRRGEGPGLLPQSLEEGELRDLAVRAKAVGPTIEMSNIGQINNDLFERLLRASAGGNPIIQFDPEALHSLGISSAADLINKHGIATKEQLTELGLDKAVRRIQLTPLEQQAIMSRSLGLTGKEEPFFKQGVGIGENLSKMFSGEGYKRFLHPNKEIFSRLKSTFWESASIPDRSISEMAYRAGTWRRLTGQVIDPDSGMFKLNDELPTFAAQWGLTQKELAEQGMPFAGLSLPERHIMATLGQAAGTNVSDVERTARSAFGADIAPITSWVDTELGVTGKNSHILKVPEWMLAEAEKEHVFDAEGVARTAFGNEEDLLAYQLSPFSYRRQSGEMGHEVGLMFRFAEGEQGTAERRNLVEFLQSKVGTEGWEALSKIDRDSQKPIVDLMTASLQNAAANTSQYGIQVGTLTGFQDKQTAKHVQDVLKQYTGENVERSNVEVSVLRQGRGETLQTSAAILGRPELMEQAEKEGLLWNSKQAGRLSEEAFRLAQNSRMMKVFTSLAKSSGESIPDTMLKKALGGYVSIRKRAPLLAIAGAALGAGYYRHRRKAADRAFDQTFEYQEPEQRDWYEDYRRELDKGYIPITKPQRGGQSLIPNPLDTSDLVHQLDQRKIAHSYMGNSPARYGYLFSRGNGL